MPSRSIYLPSSVLAIACLVGGTAYANDMGTAPPPRGGSPPHNEKLKRRQSDGAEAVAPGSGKTEADKTGTNQAGSEKNPEKKK